MLTTPLKYRSSSLAARYGGLIKSALEWAPRKCLFHLPSQLLTLCSSGRRWRWLAARTRASHALGPNISLERGRKEGEQFKNSSFYRGIFSCDVVVAPCRLLAPFSVLRVCDLGPDCYIILFFFCYFSFFSFIFCYFVIFSYFLLFCNFLLFSVIFCCYYFKNFLLFSDAVFVI